MSLMTTMASKAKQSLKFAHFAGTAKAAAEDDPKQDDDKAKAAAEDQEKKDDEAKAKAEGDDTDDPKAEGDDPEKEDDDKPASKAKAAGDGEDDDGEDDDSDKEMRGNSPAAAARRRERARCAAIFASRAAAKNPALACSLAFQTSMTRVEALSVLESSPAPASASNLDRASRNPSLGAGGDASQSSAKASASGWASAFAKVARR